MRRKPYDWAQEDDLLHQPPSHWRIVPPPVPPGYVLVTDRWAFSDLERQLFDSLLRRPMISTTKGNRMTDLTDLTTCPSQSDEERRLTEDLLLIYGVDPGEHSDRALEMIEALRAQAFAAGYRNGHYCALEESLP